jgi:NifU homolog involved in Fe-S cluster formation
MPLPYSEIVMEHFRNPRNVGRMDDPDAKAVEGSPACGDMVAVYLKVDPETQVITDIKFESYGCASNIATGSIITELAKGENAGGSEENHLGRSIPRPGRTAAPQDPLRCPCRGRPARGD